MATAGQLTWDELVFIARRTGVENWRGTDYNGRPVSGKLVLAPSSHRGRNGSMGSVVGVTRHHTGTAETFLADQDYPTYNVVKEGRSGLENSLSAYGLGRWFGLYVFSEYLSWHAGTWFWSGITDGNGHFLGTEAEGTGARWTPFQREFYPRLTASELSFIGEGVDMMPRHLDGATPRGRKNDAANLWADFTSKVQWYLDDPRRITYGATAPSPEPGKKKEIEMIVVVVNPSTGVYVPHVIAGDRYFRLLSDATRKALVAAGVPSITVGQEEHANFVRTLASEQATLELPTTPPTA